ncbi:peptidase inhibitor family I36 protein [Actinosynnema sp. NPDC020468]|uniref:peptidase inhibitor family I36 protein n=1 Tax=Actinosynnema sp. NPDC020468 TaxID=3154488 RepID=UPI0033DC9A0B
MTTTLVTLALAGLGAPAHAEGTDDCTSGAFCIWSEPRYEGQFQQTHPKVGHCYRLEFTWPDESRSRIRSFYNRTRFRFAAYVTAGCSGPATVTLPAGPFQVDEVETEVTGFRLVPACDDGAVCFYSGEDYTGQIAQHSDWNYGFCTGSGIAAKSVYNATAHTVSLFDTNGNCQNARAVDLPARTFRSFDTTFYGFRVKPRD